MRELGRARVDLAGERLLRGAAQRLAFGAGGRGVGGELEAGEPADRVALDDDFAGFVISVSSIVFSRSRRINTLVRRSTKRSARRSCSASDSLSSTPRVMPCQCSGSASQSGRFAAKVQVLMWAIRFASVSISPSVRSACATWRGEPVGRDCTLPHQETIEGRRPARHGWPARSCDSREPGRPPTAARPRRALAPSARTSSSRETCSSTWISSAIGARVSPARSASRRARPQRAERGEIERGVAPLQHLHGIEGVALQRLRQIGLERRAAAGGAERAVAHARGRRGRRSARARPG